jgi:hypothetical protein
MQGKRMRLEKVEIPSESYVFERQEEQEDTPPAKKNKDKGRSKVISLSDLKKK